MLRSVALGVLLLSVWPVTPAHAYEDQVTLAVGAGYAHAASDVAPRHGALLEVNSSFGLDPVWSVRGRGFYALHPEDTPLHVGGLAAELLYLIDVLEVVPYFGLGAGGLLGVRGAADPQVDAEVHLVLGLDYLLSRSVALELDAQPLLIVSELERDPFYFTVAAAVVFVFDE